MRRVRLIRGACSLVVLLLIAIAVSPMSRPGEGRTYTKQQARNPIADTLSYMERVGKEQGWLTVPPEHGRFLWLLIEATRPRKVLEVGSAFGYATLWLARGQGGGEGAQITSIELLEDRVEIARQMLTRAGVIGRVRLITGDAFEVVPELPDTYDFIFLDAAKADYHRFYELLLPRLRRGGLLVAHNVFSRAEEVRPFLERIEQDERVISSVVKIGDDGFALCVRR